VGKSQNVKHSRARGNETDAIPRSATYVHYGHQALSHPTNYSDPCDRIPCWRIFAWRHIDSIRAVPGNKIA